MPRSPRAVTARPHAGLLQRSTSGPRHAEAHKADLGHPHTGESAVQPLDVMRFDRDLPESLVHTDFAPRRAAVRSREKVAHRLSEAVLIIVILLIMSRRMYDLGAKSARICDLQTKCIGSSASASTSTSLAQCQCQRQPQNDKRVGVLVTGTAKLQLQEVIASQYDKTAAKGACHQDDRR